MKHNGLGIDNRVRLVISCVAVFVLGMLMQAVLNSMYQSLQSSPAYEPYPALYLGQIANVEVLEDSVIVVVTNVKALSIDTRNVDHLVFETDDMRFAALGGGLWAEFTCRYRYDTNIVDGERIVDTGMFIVYEKCQLVQLTNGG